MRGAVTRDEARLSRLMRGGGGAVTGLSRLGAVTRDEGGLSHVMRGGCRAWGLLHLMRGRCHT